MQWLAAVCVRRPVFTWVLMLTLVVVGLASARGLGVDRFPKVDFPVVIVVTQLPGAAPGQVETEVSDPLEEALNSIEGLDELRSTSFEGLSVIQAQFVLEKDVAVAAQDVRDRVNRTLSQLPREIEQPQIERVDPDAAPVMLIAITANERPREITEYADRTLRRRLETASGVGGVTVLGGRSREVQVIVNPEKLQGLGLTVADLQRALANQNVEVPGGNVLQGAQTLQLRVQGRLSTVPAFSDLVIVRRGDRIVRVRDVARVEDAEAEPTSRATLDGREVVILAVRRQTGTNTVAVVDSLRERVAEIQPTLPRGYRMQIVRDESEFIRNSIRAVNEHLVLGAVFASLVVLFFLWNVRSTVIAALAIPTSIISTFALVSAMGLTLNSITLLALTLAVGIVIDDAIVVLENIYRWIHEKAYPPRQAAVFATREIGLAVLATTLSLIAVFMPVAFMGGIVGRFMRSFGFTMSFAIAVSLLVSFTLTPMLSSRWLKPPVRGEPRPELHDVAPSDAEALVQGATESPPEPGKVERAAYLEWRRGTRVLRADLVPIEKRGRIFSRLERGYLAVLAICMRHRWVIGLAMVAALAAVPPLFRIVPKTFLPDDDESRFELSIRAPEGTSLEQTRVIADRIARDTRSIPGVMHTVTTVGAPAGDPTGRGSNEASLYVSLLDPRRRRLDQQAIMARVRNEILPRYRGERLRAVVVPVSVFGGGGAQNAAIQYVLRGPDVDVLGRYADTLLADLRRVPGVVDADTSLVLGRPEYVVQIDRARAGDLGVTVNDIASALRLLVGGDEVTTYTEGGEQYEVRVRAEFEWRDDPRRIEMITVPAADGRSVPLRDIVTITRSTGPASIQRLARQRQVTVYANVTPGTSEADVIQALERSAARLGMAPGYRASLTGRSRELGRAGQSFVMAFMLSLAFMYLVLAAQFESWIHPVTILVSLPLTVPFALLSLVLLGQSVNIFSSLGILVLFGIVKKNSILQVDHMRDLRRHGVTRADAIMVGNRDRLRPILMTTIAFVAGMVPLVASSGAGSGTNRAMGSVIMGGQTLSLLLTLLATPVVYSWLDDLVYSRAVARVRIAARRPAQLGAAGYQRVLAWWRSRHPGEGPQEAE